MQISVYKIYIECILKLSRYLNEAIAKNNH